MKEEILTKREYFAGLAMQGHLNINEHTDRQVATWAVTQADALIRELERTEK